MSVVFKNKRIKKKDFYAWFIQEWKNQGWTDISSISTDGQVMYSKGSNGKKDLYITFRENTAEGILSTTSSSRCIDVRFPKHYTPSPTPNTAGVLERPSASWWRLSLFSNNIVGLDSTMSVWYYIDKNFGSFIIEGHNGYNNGSHFFYVGNPTELKPETPSSSLVLISTNGYNITDNVAYCVDDPYSVKSYDMQLSIYSNTAPRVKSTLDNKFCGDIILGNADGFRFQIDDGIVITGSSNVIFTNTFIVEGHQYRFFKTDVTNSLWGNSLNGYNVGIRIL